MKATSPPTRTRLDLGWGCAGDAFPRVLDPALEHGDVRGPIRFQLAQVVLETGDLSGGRSDHLNERLGANVHTLSGKPVAGHLHLGKQARAAAR